MSRIAYDLADKVVLVTDGNGGIGAAPVRDPASLEAAVNRTVDRFARLDARVSTPPVAVPAASSRRNKP